MDTKNAILAKYKKMASFEDFLIFRFDQAGADNDTPFHAAAYLGNIEDIKIMVDDITDIDLTGDIGNTALHYASLKGHEKIVELLLKKGANPAIKNDYNDTPMDCVNNTNLKIIKLLETNGVTH